MDSPSSGTRERILAAAEALFAEHGFAGTSLRRVTGAAGVNLAAVHYHFGSKDGLVEAVLRRRLDPLNEQRLSHLEALESRGEPELEEVLGAFIEPALALALDGPGGSAFVRLLAHAYANRDAGLRQFLSENYGHVLKRFADLFAALLPQLGREALFWRLDLVTGALTYVMADFGISKRRSAESQRRHREQATRYLVNFAAAGMRQP